MIQVLNIRKIGEQTIDGFIHFLSPYRLLCNSLKNISALKIGPARNVFYRQVYFTGIESLKTISVIACLIGIVIITQTMNITGLDAALTGKVLVWMVVRELGPLLTAIIVIARSCAAVAAELGSMKINGEIDGLKVMGISPLKYLVVPRITGITISMLVLAVYFQIISILGGLFLSSMLMGTPFFQHARTTFEVLNISEIGISVLKIFIFGLVVSAVSCYRGLLVNLSITEIPQATTLAVMQSLFSVFILDGLITLASYL